MADVTGSAPGPTDLFVTLDEHPDSINDAWFMTNPAYGQPNQWWNLPASYHNGAVGVTFADGHALIHKWLEASTIIPVKRADVLPVNLTRASRDIQWMFQHATAPYSGN
jgi:prepilin-type processing-associated H-X9-DG protein